MQLNEQSETPETATPAQAETPGASEGEQPVSLAQALLGEVPEAKPAETQAKAEPQAGSDELPKGLHALAERLGAKPEDLYAIEVPMADGKAVKLGELKDAFAAQEEVTRRELEIEERRAKYDAELTRAKSELETLMAGLPKEALKPEVLDRIRKDALASRERERVATLEAIPEWSDEARRTNELKGIVEMMTDYGFPPNYLERNLDHRIIRLVRDSYLRKVRIERALAGVKKVQPTSTGKSRQAPPKETRQPSALGTRAGNVRALLGE